VFDASFGTGEAPKLMNLIELRTRFPLRACRDDRAAASARARMAALLAPGADICGDGAQGRGEETTVALASPSAKTVPAPATRGGALRVRGFRTGPHPARRRCALPARPPGRHRAMPPRLRAPRARPQFPARPAVVPPRLRDRAARSRC